MALQKAKLLSSGISIDYWRITQMNMNYDRLDCVVTLGGYLSKEARDDGATQLDSVQLDLSEYFHNELYANGEEKLANINRHTAYEVIKQLASVESEEEQSINFFKDSTDI